MSETVTAQAVRLPLQARFDADGRLLAADAPLLALQRAAGGDLDDPLVLPQLAEMVDEVISGRGRRRRILTIASEDQDIGILASIAPEGDGARLRIEAWDPRPRRAPRFARAEAPPEEPHFRVDARLRLESVRPDIAERFGIDVRDLPRPLTDLVALLPGTDRGIPLLDALAREEGFERQQAALRSQDFRVAFSGRPDFDGSGGLRGYEMTVFSSERPRETSEESLDDTLRSPLMRIIESADHIVDRGDGPLRSDYANYAGDIATAGRHLLSVIKSMSGQVRPERVEVDLVELSREAATMAQGKDGKHDVEIEVEPREEPLPAIGEPRGIKQILVNIVGNAVVHSPAGGTVAIVFDEGADSVSVTVADQGPGIARADQDRIFERYERLGRTGGEGVGLGLAISRRLARSMGGDIRLESAPGEGARFTLSLPTR